LLPLLLILFSIPSYSMEYYVSTSPQASDNNPGTQQSPWATPQKAAKTAQAGDTVYFEDGNWVLSDRVRFGNKGTATSPITFKAKNRHLASIHLPPTLGGAGDALFSIGIWGGSSWLEEQEMYLVFDGLDLSGGKRHTIQASGGGQLVIKNSLIHGSGNDVIKINSAADFVLIENNEIYDSGLGETQVCSTTHTCNSDGIDITSSDNVTVRGNHIHDIASWGLYTKKGSEYTVIENNLIHDVYESGIGLGESQVTYNAIARNNILRGNFFMFRFTCANKSNNLIVYIERGYPYKFIPFRQNNNIQLHFRRLDNFPPDTHPIPH